MATQELSLVGNKALQLFIWVEVALRHGGKLQPPDSACSSSRQPECRGTADIFHQFSGSSPVLSVPQMPAFRLLQVLMVRHLASGSWERARPYGQPRVFDLRTVATISVSQDPFWNIRQRTQAAIGHVGFRRGPSCHMRWIFEEEHATAPVLFTFKALPLR